MKDCNYKEFIAKELYKIAEEHEAGEISTQDALIRLYGIKVYVDKNYFPEIKGSISYISLCTVISIAEDMLKNKEQ